MCFVPALLEIVGMIIVAPKLLSISILEAAILGTVIAAVSPAVIVPKMLKLMEEGYGVKKSIPQLIMAGASVDDVFVIVLFTAFTGLAAGGTLMATDFLQIPCSILLGIIAGIICGWIVSYSFKVFHLRDSVKVLLLLSISFLLVSFEKSISSYVGFSGLLAIMSMGITIQGLRKEVAKRIAIKYSKLWVAAELLLFVLVGATVDRKSVV